MFCSVGVACVAGRTWSQGTPATMALDTVGLLMLLFGAFGRIWCAGHISGRKSACLVAIGPYSMCRHPLYFFSMFAFVGAGLCFGSLLIGTLFLTIFLATHWPTMLAEERFLTDRFGDDYRAYCARVPRFIPNPAVLDRGTEAKIQLKAFNRALIEASLIPLAFFGAQAVLRLHDAGVLPRLVPMPF